MTSTSTRRSSTTRSWAWSWVSRCSSWARRRPARVPEQTRPVIDVVGDSPRVGDRYGLSHDVWLTPEQAGLDAEYVDVTTLDGRVFPAWQIPAAKESDKWAILTHGKGAARSDTLRMARSLHKRKYNVLAITYTGDVGAPALRRRHGPLRPYGVAGARSGRQVRRGPGGEHDHPGGHQSWGCRDARASWLAGTWPARWTGSSSTRRPRAWRTSSTTPLTTGPCRSAGWPSRSPWRTRRR